MICFQTIGIFLYMLELQKKHILSGCYVNEQETGKKYVNIITCSLFRFLYTHQLSVVYYDWHEFEGLLYSS